MLAGLRQPGPFENRHGPMDCRRWPNSANSVVVRPIQGGVPRSSRRGFPAAYRKAPGCGQHRNNRPD